MLSMQVFAVLFLARHKWASRIVLWCIAAYILAMQILDLTRGFFNIAFSTFAFWLFIAGTVIPWRPIKAAAAYCALLAGGIYTSGYLLRPELLTHMGTFGIAYMAGFLTHDLLIVGAMLLLSLFEVKKYDAAVVGGVLAVAIVFTELGEHVFHMKGINAFLIGMIEGTALKQELFTDIELTWWWYILWYIVMAALLWGVWELMCFINRRLLRYGNVLPGKLVW